MKIMMSILLCFWGISAIDSEPLKEIRFNFESKNELSYEHFLGASSGNLGKLVSDVSKTGTGALLLQNESPDDARFVYTFESNPESFYEVDLWYRAELTKENAKVNISVMGDNVLPVFYGDTGGTWKKITHYGKTGPGQKEVKLAFRLGFYGNLALGKVWFDDINIKKMDDGSIYARSWMVDSPAAVSEAEKKPPQFNTLIFTFWILFSLLIIYFLIRLARPNSVLEKIKKEKLWVFGILAVSAIVKIAIAYFTSGYTNDQNLFISWGEKMYKLGPTQFYNGEFADYPPLYMYVLWALSGISHLFNLGNNYLLFKLPAIFADIGIGLVLYKIVKGGKKGLIGVIFAAILPLFVMDGAVWGQVDSISTLVLLVAVYYLEKKNLYWASAYFALAILVKPQALLLAPLAIVAIIKEWKGLKTLATIPIALGVFLIASLPFWISNGMGTIFELYGNTMGEYPYQTLNAANIFSLVNGNWASTDLSFIGIPTAFYGYALFLAALVLIGVKLFKSKDAGNYLMAAGLIIAASFVFLPRMHERYLFPVAIFLFAAWQFRPQSFILRSSLFAGLLSFANIYIVLEYSKMNTTNIPYDGLNILLSVAHIVLFIWTLVLFLRGGQTELSVKPELKPFSEPFKPENTKAIWLFVGGLTLIVGILSFNSLGSNKAPEHFYLPDANKEAVFEFEKPEKVDKLYYYIGLGTGSYLVESLSPEGKFQTLTEIKNDNRFEQFRWRFIKIDKNLKVVKVKLISGDLQMSELVFTNDLGVIAKPRLIQADTKLNLPASNPGLLFDEQNQFEVENGSFEGMYFDEIYHARSALEMLEHKTAQENTHPPLGKIMIGWGIQLFGMNPFGWRFMGTLIGVLMIPVLFLLGRRLFKSNAFGFIAAMLFSLDLMRLGQTRIATIDSYVLFFILGAYAALLWFIQVKPQPQFKFKDYIPLLISGISIGCAIASKWIGIYGAIGLAILFFIHIVRSQGAFTEKKDYHRWLGNVFIVAPLVFIIIPAIIYTLSYIPEMRDSGRGLQAMLDNQSSMWNYHSQLVATHPYTSMWYSWPFMIKPMFYFSGLNSMQVGNLTMWSFGNILLWWAGFVALVFIIIQRIVLWQKAQNGILTEKESSDRSIMTYIILGYLAQFLPWAIIPRSILFIYHYFAAIPFLVFAIVYALQQIRSKSELRFRICFGISVGLFFLYFLIYYPVATGVPATELQRSIINATAWWVAW